MEVIIKYKDGREETFEDVERVFVNSKNELYMRIWWIGEQTADAYIPMNSIECYSIYN